MHVRRTWLIIWLAASVGLVWAALASAGAAPSRPGPSQAFDLYFPIVSNPATPTATRTATATATTNPTATSTATTTPTRTPTPTTTLTPTRASEVCAPEYPTVCIPPPPPDLDCGDISYRRFLVLPPDRHRFDTDHDGIGCESG